MNSTPISGTTRPASGFFATVLGGISEGVARIGSDILPNWAAQQFIDQEKDMLYTPTNYLIPGTRPETLQDPTPKAAPVLFDINKIGTQFTAGSLLTIAAIGIGGYFLAKKFL